MKEEDEDKRGWRRPPYLVSHLLSPVLLLQMGGHGEGRYGEEVKSKMEEKEEEDRNKKKEVEYQVGFD